MAHWTGSGAGGGESLLPDNRAFDIYRGSHQLFTARSYESAFFSAVINRVVAVPVMAMMMLITSNKAIMGGFTIAGSRRIIGWLATAIMAAPLQWWPLQFCDQTFRS
jgi:hypothetical protein